MTSHVQIPATIRHAFETNDASYGWAQQMVFALCRFNPANIAFLAGAPDQTRHYVCLCLAALHARPDTAPTLKELADRIASEARRTVLAELWGHDLGSLKVLRQLSSVVFDEEQYVQLAELLIDPVRRQVLSDAGKIYPGILNNIARMSDTHRDTYTNRLISRIGGTTLAFFESGIKILRSDLTIPEIRTRLNAVKNSSELDDLITRLVKDNALPAAPWAGTDSITPISTVASLKATGLRMKNCLATSEKWFEALSGQHVFYYCDGDEPCIVSLQRHSLFGLWFVSSLKGKDNRTPSTRRKEELAAIFAKAGYPTVRLSRYSGMTDFEL